MGKPSDDSERALDPKLQKVLDGHTRRIESKLNKRDGLIPDQKGFTALLKAIDKYIIDLYEESARRAKRDDVTHISRPHVNASKEALRKQNKRGIKHLLGISALVAGIGAEKLIDLAAEPGPYLPKDVWLSILLFVPGAILYAIAMFFGKD